MSCRGGVIESGYDFVDVFVVKQKKAYEDDDCDWSSDVCASDLLETHSCGSTVAGAQRGRADSAGADRLHAPKAVG